jgi:integrase
VERRIAECAWEDPRNVTPDSFVAWRSGQRKSPKTLNEHLNAIRGLLNWMRRQGRIDANALADVERADRRGKSSFERRALTLDEGKRLLVASERRRPAYLAAL